MQAGTARRRIHNEINITPLTDVFLVLLIIMMLLQTAATLRYAGQIRPPQVDGAQAIKQAEQNCIIEVTGKGTDGAAEKLSIDKQEIAKAEELGPILKTKAAAGEKSKLLLRADKDASSDMVLQIVEQIQAAASDQTLSTTQRQFLSTLTISVENLVSRTPPGSPEEKPAAGATP